MHVDRISRIETHWQPYPFRAQPQALLLDRISEP